MDEKFFDQTPQKKKKKKINKKKKKKMQKREKMINAIKFKNGNGN